MEKLTKVTKDELFIVNGGRSLTISKPVIIKEPINPIVRPVQPIKYEIM